MKLQLVLTDDWELKGDGSGCIQALQVEPMRRLARLYEHFGFRASFFVEVMQQLSHLRLGRRYPDLMKKARRWEKSVRDVFLQGHDIQLHVHPQWRNARYEGGQWHLDKNWSILDCPREEMSSMLEECKDYLERLLGKVDPDYRTVAFRSGFWFLAPHEHLLTILAQLGIVLDASIVPGKVLDLKVGRLDYRDVEEPFLPYYPQMHDARRVADKPQPICCVPTQPLRLTAGEWLKREVLRGAARAVAPAWCRKEFTPPNQMPIPGGRVNSGYTGRWMTESSADFKGMGGGNGGVDRGPFRLPVYSRSDLAAMSFYDMKALLRQIRRSARKTRWPIVPAVIMSHTKNLGDLEAIRRFCTHIAECADMEVITLRELARNLRAGLYPIKAKKIPARSMADSTLV